MILSFIYGIIDEIRRWCGLVFPVLSTASDVRRWGRTVWMVLHVVFVLLLLAGLGWLNHIYQDYFSTQLAKRAPVFVRNNPVFLPLVGALIIALAWLLYWIWTLLTDEADDVDFEDVRRDWDEGMHRLQAEGVRPSDAPLFLILGRPASGEEFLFQAGQVTTAVAAPTRSDAAVRVFSNRDAIYVTARNASGTGRLASALADGESPAEAAGAADAAAEDMFKTQRPDDQPLLKEVLELTRKKREGGLTPEEELRLKMLAESPNPMGPRGPVRLPATEANRQARRLNYLCRLITRDRRPFVPINGILAVVPWAALETEESAKDFAALLQRDLAEARRGLKLVAPIFAIVGDFEQSPGFAEFMLAFPGQERQRRVGQRLPMAPASGNAEELVEQGVTWVGTGTIPNWVIKGLRGDGGTANRKLFRLYKSTHERFPRLGRLLRQSLSGLGDGDRPAPFCGCYLAAVGRTPDTQAFLPGVFKRLDEQSANLSWTNDALVEDESARRTTMIGYGAQAVVLAGVVAWLVLGK